MDVGPPINTEELSSFVKALQVRIRDLGFDKKREIRENIDMVLNRRIGPAFGITFPADLQADIQERIAETMLEYAYGPKYAKLLLSDPRARAMLGLGELRLTSIQLRMRT